MTICGRKIADEDMANIASYMDDDIRGRLHSIAMRNDWTNEQFIDAYLMEDPMFEELLRQEFDFRA